MGPVRRKMYGRDNYDEKCHYDDRRRSPVSHHHRPKHQARKSLYVPVPLIDDSGHESHTMMYVLVAGVTGFLFMFVVILLCGAGGAFTRPPPPVAYQSPQPVLVQPRYDPLAVG